MRPSESLRTPSFNVRASWPGLSHTTICVAPVDEAGRLDDAEVAAVVGTSVVLGAGGVAGVEVAEGSLTLVSETTVVVAETVALAVTKLMVGA